jgi:hypothetical protein
VDLDFDGVCRWLDARMGGRVFASTQPATEDAGNTRLSVQGVLGRADGEIVLVDASPGRIEAFSVGDATLVLLEGDFVAARSGSFGAGLPAMVSARFRDLEVVLGDLSDQSHSVAK